ncbi:hypothetical protein [Nesterenkonia pannonica]|uniref:hypothetical protein n=1 Tax=Nesterenkonia pannonica TaxID=1548602 RepID=UPI0021642DBE|nr:hypothetical protein [Nesterenkonia pannonica]
MTIWTLGRWARTRRPSPGRRPRRARSTGPLPGIFSMHKSLAMVIGPVLGGFVLETFGASVLWLGAAGFCAIAA